MHTTPDPRAQRVSLTERQAGKRAAFHVYYTHKGKPRFYPVFGVTTFDEARDRLLGICWELHMRDVQITSVVACDQSVPL